MTAPIYEFHENGEENGRVLGELVRVGELTHTDKLKASGMNFEMDLEKKE